MLSLRSLPLEGRQSAAVRRKGEKEVSARGRRRGAFARAAGPVLALALAACTTGSLQPVTPIPVSAAQTAHLVSSYRAQHGLAPVSVDSRLMVAAETQARAMGERDRIGHRVAGALPRRITQAGYDWGAAAENLGAGYRSLDATMAGWRSSSGHRANLLNPNVTEIGVAAVATPPGSKHSSYWALILAAPVPERPEPTPSEPGRSWSGLYGSIPFGVGVAQ